MQMNRDDLRAAYRQRPHLEVTSDVIAIIAAHLRRAAGS